MSDVINEIQEEVLDTYKSHWTHQSFHSNCSECFKERRTRLENYRRAKEQLGCAIGRERACIDDPRWTNNPLE